MIDKLIHKKYTTPLGIIECGMSSNDTIISLSQNRKYKNGKSEIFVSKSHQIELIEFKIHLPLKNGGTVSDSNGWIWRITKINEHTEDIQLECRLTETISDIDYDIATGEHLDAREYFNDE